MTYVAPAIKEKFDTLSPELQDIILAKDIKLNSIHDLIHVLEGIVGEE